MKKTLKYMGIALLILVAVSLLIFIVFDLRIRKKDRSGILYECAFSNFNALNTEDKAKFCRPIGSILDTNSPTMQDNDSSTIRTEEEVDQIIIPEYHAVLDILKRPDVHEVIDKYHSTEAWVKALNYQFVEDREYLNRILPGYSDMNIHCVIMLHSPEGQRVFIEDGDKHHAYLEISADEFFTSLNNASDEDVNNFWLHLR